MKHEKKSSKVALILLFLSLCFAHNASYYVSASQLPFAPQPPPSSPKPEDVPGRPDTSRSAIQKVIQERLRVFKEKRKALHEVVKPVRGNKKEIGKNFSPLDSTLPIYAAVIDTIQEKSLAAFENTIKKLKLQKVNTLIIRMSQGYDEPVHRLAKPRARIGVYFKSHYAPLVDDLLTPIVDLAHRHRIRVFARITTRQSAWAAENNPQWQDTGYDPVNRALIPIIGLNLFNLEVRYYLINLLRELAQYPIDGIILSDDYAMNPMEGYSSEALTEYSHREDVNLNVKRLLAGVIRRDKGGGYFFKKFQKELLDFYNWKSRKMGEFAVEIVKNIRALDFAPKIGFLLGSSFLLQEEQVLTSLSLDVDEMVKADFDYYFIFFNHREFFTMYRDIDTGYENLADVSRDLRDKISEKLLWIIYNERGRKGRGAYESRIFKILQTINPGNEIAYGPYNVETNPVIINKYLSQSDSSE